MPLMLLAVFAKITYAYEEKAPIAVSCCDIYNAFDKFIPSSTGDASACSAANDCESTRLRFLFARLQQLHGQSITMSDTDILLNVTDAKMLADILVSRMLAQYVSHEGYQDKDTLHFYFDETSRTLKQVFSACVFEKELYVALLVISVGLLILCLLLQMQQQTVDTTDKQRINSEMQYTLVTNSKVPDLKSRFGRR